MTFELPSPPFQIVLFCNVCVPLSYVYAPLPPVSLCICCCRCLVILFRKTGKTHLLTPTRGDMCTPLHTHNHNHPPTRISMQFNCYTLRRGVRRQGQALASCYFCWVTRCELVIDKRPTNMSKSMTACVTSSSGCYSTEFVEASKIRTLCLVFYFSRNP